MGRTKGSKNKAQDSTSMGSVTVTTTGAVNNQPTDVIKNNSFAHAVNSELDPERAEIVAEYERSLESTEAAPAEATAVEDTKIQGSEEKPEDIKENKGEKSPEQPAEPVSETYAADTKPEETDEDKTKNREIKTVPYDALHEEREKRKAAQAKARELEEKVKILESLTAQEKPKSQEDESYLSDEEKRVRLLEREIAEIRTRDRMREEATKLTAQEQAKRELDKLIADTDENLAKEGFPGFKFLSGRVGDELTRLLQENPDDTWLSTPEGWKKIYKEKIFPSARGLFVQAERDKLMADKKNAKSDASLSSSTGQRLPSAKKDENDGYSYDEYLAMRMKSNP